MSVTYRATYIVINFCFKRKNKAGNSLGRIF